jgi:hypothetical protein
MPFVVEKDKSANPGEINFFGADRVVFGAQEVPDVVKQLRLACGRHFCDSSSHVVVRYVPRNVEFAASKCGSVSLPAKTAKEKLYF